MACVRHVVTMEIQTVELDVIGDGELKILFFL